MWYQISALYGIVRALIFSGLWRISEANMRFAVSGRGLLKCGYVLGSSLLFYCNARAQSQEVRPETFTYKTVGDLAIKADVYRYTDVRARPVVVWIHGGALIGGNRSDIDRRVKKHALDAGYVLISLDYRLAPETKLPEIIQDIEDAFKWIHRDGPRLFNIDPNQVAAAGSSAGGYLTLTAGYRVRPRPAVMLSLWGYGDLIGDWYSKPSSHARHNRSKVTREEAYRQVSGRPISDSRDRKGNGGLFYEYCRQTGTWPTAVSGWDPSKDREKFNPFMPVKNVNTKYPPTVLVHGTNDTDVPYEQSVLMADQFKERNVPHAFITVPNAEHGLSGGDSEQIKAAYAKAFAFIDEHLRK
jgi:acetyl esterase/lipase